MKLALSFYVLSTAVLSAQFVDTATNLKDLPQIADGFEISLFARDPLVRNPCSLAFDARGRMFVGMGPQYRHPTPETPPDRVVIVQDTDDDGGADKIHTFATGFNCIQSLAWRGRDLWVANAPDLTVVRDLDGDDVADEYVRVFTDLGNIEHGLHGLSWAPDGRLYMTKGNSKGVVIRDWKKDEPDRLAPKPFRELWGVPGPANAPDFPAPKTFTRETYRNTYQDPRDDWGRMGGVLRCEDMGKNIEIVARGFRNPYDLAFDQEFNWLGTDQDQNEGDRIVMPFLGADFGWSHAWSPHWTGENHPPTAPVSGPVFPGSGTGIVFANSKTWPEKYRGVFIINDWLLKSTHVYRPAWSGALMQPQSGKWENFIVGKDALYRPVDLEFGPGGALYILGWGRGYGVERDQKGEMTNEGRIFRVQPKGGVILHPRPTTKLAEWTVTDLIADLASDVPVRRIDAQDELVRRGSSIHAELARALDDPRLASDRETWLLWVLARSGAADADFAKRAKDGSINQRIQALRILGERKASVLAEVVNDALSHPEARLRFAAIQAVHRAANSDLLDKLITHAGVEKERLCAYATWRALRDLASPGRLKPLLTSERAGIRAAALLALLDQKAIPNENLQSLAKDDDAMVKSLALLGLGKSTPAGKPMPLEIAAFDIAKEITSKNGRPSATGKVAIGQPTYTDRPYRFKHVPASLDGAYMIRTANEDDSSTGDDHLSFELALDATVMVAHDTRIRERPRWLDAFADTDLVVASTDTTFRLWSRDYPAGRVTLGGNLLRSGGAKANYFVIIQPKPLVPRAIPSTQAESLAMLTQANPSRGEALFFLTAQCATCHRVADRGINFGPDLTNLGDRMETDHIVQSILDPNAVITEGFSTHAIEAADKSYSGILLSTGAKVKLGLAGGKTVEIPAETITKHDIAPTSGMPPMAALLAPQDVADLAAWLRSQKATAAAPPVAPAKEAVAANLPVGKAALPAGDGIRFALCDDRIVIAHSGQPLAEYVFRDPKVLRPYFANVHTLSGKKVTRNHPPLEGTDAIDHADMHPGIWFGFGDISGHDFWRNKARIEHVGFTTPPTLKDGAFAFKEESRLVTADGERLATMTSDCVLKLMRKPDAAGLLITWEIGFRDIQDSIALGDQEEMGFGARVATSLAEKSGGTITASTGLRTAAKTWGQEADWCDYSGTIAGEPCGITLLASPKNFRRSWWHNRDYGVFVANPFGRAAMKQGEKSVVTVTRGESLSLRFGAIIHSSPDYDPAAAYREFAEPSSSKP